VTGYLNRRNRARATQFPVVWSAEVPYAWPDTAIECYTPSSVVPQDPRTPPCAEKWVPNLGHTIAEPPHNPSLPSTGPWQVGEQILPVLLLGGPARRALGLDCAWEVLAAFRRSLYCLSAQGSVVCIGPPSLGPGPLSILADLPPDLDWRGRGIRPGTPAHWDGVALRLAPGLVFSCAAARPWQPAAPSGPWDVAVFSANVQTLAAEVRRRAQQDGLAPLIPALLFGGPFSPHGHRLARELSQIAAPVVQDLRTWLESVMPLGSSLAPPPASVARLIGLGPGLTPSGDDLLGGMMIALRSLGWPSVADAVGASVLPLARSRTHAISYAHLACAAHGQGAGAVHDATVALCSPEDPRMQEHLDDLGCLGHSSGWDALAGVALVARAACTARAGQTHRQRGEEGTLLMPASRLQDVGGVRHADES